MKSYLLFLTFLFTSFFCQAQTSLGFKVGGNFDLYEVVTNIESKTRNYESYFGIHFGMALDVPVYDDIVSFTPELQLRVRDNFEEEDNNLVADIDIPLLFTAYLYPFFGLDLGPELRYEVVDVHRIGDEWFKDEAPLKKFDFGIAGGARFKVNDGPTILLRLYLGLNNLNEFEDPSLPIDSQTKIFNRSIQLSFISGGGRGY